MQLFYMLTNEKANGSQEAKRLLTYAIGKIYGLDYLSEEKFRSENGKEYFKNQKIFYNVSHTDGAVCCAVSNFEVGCDIEKIVGKKSLYGIAKRFFSVSDCEKFEHSGYNEKTFYQIWTFYESYAKQDGRGLSLCLCELKNGNLKKNIQSKGFLINELYAVCASTENDDIINAPTRIELL